VPIVVVRQETAWIVVLAIELGVCAFEERVEPMKRGQEVSLARLVLPDQTSNPIVDAELAGILDAAEVSTCAFFRRIFRSS
jgi:hypothetical protein